jgi:nucleotide-binding universal stress UspA family protein
MFAVRIAAAWIYPLPPLLAAGIPGLPERWPSGRRRPPAKRVYGQKPYRGFESHPLRHFAAGARPFDLPQRPASVKFASLERMKHILVATDLSPLADRAFERAAKIAEAHEARLTAVHVIDEQVLAYENGDREFGSKLAGRAKAGMARQAATLPKSVAARFGQIIRTGSPSGAILEAATQTKADLIVLGLHRIDPLRDLFIGTTAERIIRHAAVPVLMVKDKPAGPYRKIVVTTDFSPSSSHALLAAFDLAPGAQFTLLHIFETPFPGLIRLSEAEVEAYRKERDAEAAGQVKSDLEQFLSAHVGERRPSVTTLCERGEAVTGIARAVDRLEPELLVIGTNRGAGPGSLLGSCAAVFLNDPPCDVLVSR